MILSVSLVAFEVPNSIVDVKNAGFACACDSSCGCLVSLPVFSCASLFSFMLRSGLLQR